MATADPSKYAIAQINIPIEIFPNGEWTNYNDRISIQIVRITELPPISEIDTEQIQTTIQDILGECDTEESAEFPFIVKDGENTETDSTPTTNPPQPMEYINREELLARPRRHQNKNSSFKRTPYKSHNRTKRDWIFTSR